MPFPSPGDLPNPGMEPRSPALQADSLPSELQVMMIIIIGNQKRIYSMADVMVGSLRVSPLILSAVLWVGSIVSPPFYK